MAITPSSRIILCGNDFYKTKYSKIFRILLVVFEEKKLANIDDFFGFKTQFVQKVIFADLTFINYNVIVEIGAGMTFITPS